MELCIIGTIPSAIGDLSNLLAIIISRNRFCGNFSSLMLQIANPINFRELDLSYNNFKGILIAYPTYSISCNINVLCYWDHILLYCIGYIFSTRIDTTQDWGFHQFGKFIFAVKSINRYMFSASLYPYYCNDFTLQILQDQYPPESAN